MPKSDIPKPQFVYAKRFAVNIAQITHVEYVSEERIILHVVGGDKVDVEGSYLQEAIIALQLRPPTKGLAGTS